MEQLEEFKNRVKKVRERRQHKVINSYGVKDAFLYYRKIRPKEHKYVLTDLQYLHIIRSINDLLRDFLIAGEDLYLPERMGSLELRKRTTTVEFKDGKLKVTKPVNWDATLKLWYTDKESFDRKQLVREESSEVFKVYYNKSNANYNNKSFYQFLPNRQIKIGLKNNINRNKIEAFKYGI